MNAPESRNEAILQATLDGTEYTAPPQSRIESLLLQLKAAIEDGGGGGGDTKLAAKVNAIEAQLFSTIADVPTNTDSGSMDLYSKDLNTITTSGFYNAMTCTNAPAQYCTLVVIGYYLAGYCTQIAADVTTGTLYTRTQTNGTWGAWSAKTNTADLAAVATSGAYSDLSGKPNLAAVATSGAYSDLTGKPTIDSAMSSSSTNAVQNKVVNAALAAETTARETADTKHTAALAEIIDGGAKNLLTVSSGNNTTAQRFVDVPCTAKAGTYVLYFGHLESNDTDSTTCSVSFKDASSVDVASPAEYQFQRGDGVYKIITLKNDNLAKIRIYGANNYATSAGDVVTFSEAMLCTKSAWDISQKYVPYCPTMSELYAMIQALQSGTSTVSLQSISPAADLTGGAEKEVDA